MTFGLLSFRIVNEKLFVVDLPSAAPSDVMAPMLCSGKPIFLIFGSFFLRLVYDLRPQLQLCITETSDVMAPMF